MKRILAAALLLISPAVLADSGLFNVKEASGEAAIVNNDKKAAEQEAKEKALRDAVEKGAGSVIDSATLVEGGVAISDKIFSHANGYVKHFDIAESKDQGDGTWKVTLTNVQVASGDMSKDVAAIRAAIIKQGHPRMMLMVSEQSIEEATPRGWWVQGQQAGNNTKEQHNTVTVSSGIVEQEIIKRLAPLGWKFVDPQVAFGKIKVGNSAGTEITAAQAREFGKVTGAEYVVLGNVLLRPEEASGKEASMGFNVASFVNYRMTLRVVNTDTGDIVATDTVTDTEKGLISVNQVAAKAMSRGAVDIADRLQKHVLEAWRQKDMGDGNLHVVATGDYSSTKAFREVLSKLVKDVQPPKFKDGVADFSLVMTGVNTARLADQLDGKSLKGGYTVHVTQVTDTTLEVKLSK